MHNLRRYLIAGILVWLPLIVTVWLVRLMVNLVDRTLLVLPDALQPEALLGFPIPGLGFVLAAVTLLVTGMLVTNLLGRRLVKFWEDLLGRIPIVRAIYSASKQLSETLFNGAGKSFRKVCLVQYPRSGMWVLAFVTGEGNDESNRRTGHNLVNIFVPTTPNPTSGFFLMAPRDDVIELDMPVEIGLRLILSGGAVGENLADKRVA
jgi:uncharacterized membrane protein